MARAKSLRRPRSTVTAYGGDSLPTTRLSWIGISAPSLPWCGRSWRAFLPREQHHVQPREDRERLQEQEEDPVALPVEQAAARPSAREHGAAQQAAERDRVPAQQRVARERDGTGDVHAERAHGFGGDEAAAPQPVGEEERR